MAVEDGIFLGASECTVIDLASGNKVKVCNVVFTKERSSSETAVRRGRLPKRVAQEPRIVIDVQEATDGK